MPTYLTGEHLITQINFAETMQSIKARAYDQVRFAAGPLKEDQQLEKLLAALLKNRGTRHRYSFSDYMFNRLAPGALVAEVLADPNFVLQNYNNAWLGKHAQALGIALQNPSSELTSLAIYGRDFSDPGKLVHVANALQNQHCKLTDLRIDSFVLSAEAALALAIGLESDKSAEHKLKTVSLHFVNAAMNMQRISQALAHPNCAVTELTLMHLAANDEAVLSLAEALVQPSCKLETVVLQWGRLTDDGILSLATAIKSGHCRLTKLDLAHCNEITAAGVRALFQACAGPHCTITTLRLRWLDNALITDDCVAELVKGLGDPTCRLRDINLQITDISVQGRADIIQALQQYGGTVHMDWPLSSLLGLEAQAARSPEQDVGQELQRLRAGRQILCNAVRQAKFNGHVTLCFALESHDQEIAGGVVYRGFVASILEVFSGMRCAATASVTIKLTRDEDYSDSCYVMWALIAALEKQGGVPPLPENLIIDIGAGYTPTVILALMAAVRNGNCPHNLTLQTTELELSGLFTDIFKAPATGAVDHRPGLVARNFHLTGSAAIDAADKAFYTAMCGPEAENLVTMAAVAHEVDVATECVHMLCRVWTIEKPADYFASKTQRDTTPPAAAEPAARPSM